MGPISAVFVVVVLVVVVSVLLIISRICSNNRRLLTTDYTKLIDDSDRKIAYAVKALARARVAEENYRRSNPFPIPTIVQHRYGYNPNQYEREVDRWEETLNRLKYEKQYYEEQKRKADELRRRLR